MYCNNFKRRKTHTLQLGLNRRELHLMKERNKVESKSRSDLGNKRQCIVLYYWKLTLIC